MSVNVNILFFAQAKEISGKSKDVLCIKSPIHYSDLLNLIVTRYSLEALKNTIILAVNEDYCSKDEIYILKSEDEIAVIPPLSGG